MPCKFFSRRKIARKYYKLMSERRFSFLSSAIIHRRKCWKLRNASSSLLYKFIFIHNWFFFIKTTSFLFFISCENFLISIIFISISAEIFVKRIRRRENQINERILVSEKREVVGVSSDLLIFILVSYLKTCLYALIELFKFLLRTKFFSRK